MIQNKFSPAAKNGAVFFNKALVINYYLQCLYISDYY